MTSFRCPDQLFTRQQVADITGLDASTLNYWMRESIIRCQSGGTGRGSHRRFAYHQVTLAALLCELRNFGIGTPALARLAARFHEAMDWMAARDISRSNLEPIADAVMIRKKIVLEGHWAWRVKGPEDEELFAGLPRHAEAPGWDYVHLDWEQAVAFWFRARNPPKPEFRLTPAEKNLVGSWSTREDLRAFDDAQGYYRAITAVNLREPGDHFSTSPEFFHRNEAGDLVMTPDASAAQASIGFIGIDLERLTYRLWKGRLA